MNKNYSNTSRQTGGVLLVSLTFLIIIGLLGLSSLQTARLELRMAGNEEVRTNAFQTAQALVDVVVANPAMTPVSGGVGFTVCTAGQANCDLEAITMPGVEMAPEVDNGHLAGTAVLIAPGNTAPPRGLGFSADKFAASRFEMTSTYDRSDEGLGRSSVTVGLLIVTPSN